MPNSPYFTRFLPRNEGNRRPSLFAFVHVETTATTINSVKPYVEHVLNIGQAIAVEWRQGRSKKEASIEFTDADTFWDFLSALQRGKSVLWVVMHDALRTLTVLNLWEQMEDHRYQTWKPGYEYVDRRTGHKRKSEPWKGMVAIDGRPFHLETEGPRGRVNFTDIRNYYHCELEKLPDGGSPVQTIKQAYLGLVDRWEKEQNGNWHFSASGLAWSNWRHKFKPEEIIIHNHAEALTLEWNCLYGGECRCWFRGLINRPLIEYDVNSLYPYCMLDRVYPTALIDHFKGDCYDKLSTYIDKYCTAAEVDIDTDTDHYPWRQGKQTVYPVGKFRTFLCGPELLRAHDSGCIRAVHSLSIYTSANIFTDYVIYWWQEKLTCTRKGDTAGALFAKLMLNSLPAKFAQRTPVWVDNKDIDVVKPWKVFPWTDTAHHITYPARSVGWRGQHLAERVPAQNSFPLIYAYVTAYAREHMRRLRSYILPEYLLYQDTDSLIIVSGYAPPDNGMGWNISDGIGRLKVKGHYNYATFRGQKNYTVDERNVIAGVQTTDHSHGNNEWTGTRVRLGDNLFGHDHTGKLTASVVDFSTPGNDTAQRYDYRGWAIPVRLP